ncbi:hypothetical protein PTKIN_Ptkin11bG0144600 [Pterospermum kingtungense]
MMTLILLELRGPGWYFKRELQVHQLKIVRQILQRLLLKCSSFNLLLLAKAAIQAGLRKGNVRERSAPSKINSPPGNENRRRDQMSNSSDSSRLFPRSPQRSDDEANAKKTASSSVPVSMLLIPSLKEVIAEDSGGSVA